MTNYMKNVAEMLGVKLHEEFYVIHNNGSSKVVLEEEGIRFINHIGCLKEDAPAICLQEILNGTFQIEHIMKEETRQERESVDRYIKSISKPTGINFYDYDGNKLDYSELREEIHKILCDFLSYEHPLQNDGEFDFEFLEFRTDDILRLIRRQGGTITK